jgi:hypothetical protein
MLIKLLAVVFGYFLLAAPALVNAERTHELAKEYCARSNCENYSPINDFIESPVEGTCIVVSRLSVYHDFSKVPSPNTWWLIFSKDLPDRQYDLAISVAKMFSLMIDKQVYLAEPFKVSFADAKSTYCTTTLDLSSGYAAPFALFIPRF